jgi:hypothetical protein
MKNTTAVIKPSNPRVSFYVFLKFLFVKIGFPKKPDFE